MHKPPDASKSPHWWWVWIASAVAWPPITAILMISSGDQFIRGIIWFVTGVLCLVGGVFSSFAIAQSLLSRRRPHPNAVFGLALLFMLAGVLLLATTCYPTCIVVIGRGRFH